MQPGQKMDTETLRLVNREYLENRIRSAHPLELVTMLYQVAIDSLNASIDHLKTADHFARSREITRAEQAVHELLVALDHTVQAPFTRTLADLYRYCLERMAAGHAGQSEAAFREALAILTTLASAWNEIKAGICDPPPGGDSAAELSPQEQGPLVPEELVSDPYAGYRQSPGIAVARDWSC